MHEQIGPAPPVRAGRPPGDDLFEEGVRLREAASVEQQAHALILLRELSPYERIVLLHWVLDVPCFFDAVRLGPGYRPGR
ncbi:hypothetical protein GCM10018954_020090 [Kutzneria kofuensis]